MQSILSVFRRPSQPASTPTQRRKSSSIVSPTTQVTPRHLHLEPEEPQSQPQSSPTPTEPPSSTTPTFSPPPPRSISTRKTPLPPPPRSRQVSSNSIVTTRAFSNAAGPPPSTSNPNLNTDTNISHRPLYLAIYIPRASGETLPGEARYTLALHLPSTTNKSLRVYRLQPAQTEPYDWTQTRYSMSEDELRSDPLMVGRVLLGYVTEAAVSEPAQQSLDHVLDTVSTPKSHAPNFTWFKDAVAALRTAGLLTANPPPPPPASALPPPHTTTTTTMPPPTIPHTTPTPTPPPPHRPSLPSRATDNWNDIPENFLSPDSSTNSSNGGSLGRRKARGTPRVTPLVTPRGSLGSLRLSSVGGLPPAQEMVGEEEKSWDEIMREVEGFVAGKGKGEEVV